MNDSRTNTLSSAALSVVTLASAMVFASAPAFGEVEATVDRQLVVAARTALAGYMPANVEHVDLEPITNPPGDPCGNREVTTIESRPRVIQKVKPREWLALDIKCGDAFMATHVQWFEVRAYGQAPVPIRHLSSGQDVFTRDVAWKTFDLASLHDVPAVIDERAVCAKGSIPVGEPILAAFVEACPDVRRGRPVQATIRSGSVVLNFSAMAKQSANKGQEVEIVREGAEAPLLAEVTGKSMVEVAP